MSDRSAPPQDPFREGPEASRARRRRSVGLALLLVALGALVFVITLVRLGGHGG